MEGSAREADRGLPVVEEAGAAFKEILGAVQEVDSQVADVATASRQVSEAV